MNVSASGDDSSFATDVIDDSALLYRRIPGNQVITEEDDAGNQRLRPSCACFTDNATPMSLYEAERWGGLNVVMKGYQGFYLVSITAGQMREVGLSLRWTSEGGPGHCEAIAKKTGSVRSKLARAAKWVIHP